MIYYFSGAYQQDLKRSMNIDQLFSFYHERKLVIDTINYKKENPDKTFRIMLDSGAFTHFQQSKKKGIILSEKDIQDYTDEYIAYLNEWGDYLECFVGVDSVPDPENVDPTYAKRTWDNYLYMYARLRSEIRDKLIPVFHFNEDFRWLKNMLEYRHEDGTPISYIGLAISLEGVKKVRIAWANKCRKMIEESSNPNVKTHAFGVGVKSVLENINVTSTDATSWVKRAAYGMISIDDIAVPISDVQEQNIGGKHYTEKSVAHQEGIEKIIKDRGYDLEDIKTSPYTRAKFNIEDTLLWLDKVGNKKQSYKCDLWE